MPPQNTPEQKPREGYGAFVGALIVVVVLVIGALYFWGAELNRRNTLQNPPIAADPSTTAQ